MNTAQAIQSDDLFPVLPTHNPGGKVRIKLKLGITGSAVFGGAEDCYRYRLARSRGQFSLDAPTVMFLMMNPSTASWEYDDPTVAKCWRLAQTWSARQMLVGNVHAYRCTDQSRLAEVADPFGPDNLTHLIAMALVADTVVVGYGTPRIKTLRERGPAVARALIAAGIQLHVLRLSKDGVPCHPLYLPEILRPVAWGGPDCQEVGLS